MSNVKMTVKQCMDLNLWNKYCVWSGCNPYAINEGLVNYDDVIEFDSEFKKEEIMFLEDWDKIEIDTKVYYIDKYNNKPVYGYFAGIFKTLIGVFLSLAAGTMLFVVLDEIIPKSKSLYSIIGFLLGTIIVYCI